MHQGNNSQCSPKIWKWGASCASLFGRAVQTGPCSSLNNRKVHDGRATTYPWRNGTGEGDGHYQPPLQASRYAATSSAPATVRRQITAREDLQKRYRAGVEMTDRPLVPGLSNLAAGRGASRGGVTNNVVHLKRSAASMEVVERLIALGYLNETRRTNARAVKDALSRLQRPPQSSDNPRR
jgi:hypothetical protein